MKESLNGVIVITYLYLRTLNMYQSLLQEAVHILRSEYCYQPVFLHRGKLKHRHVKGTCLMP